jgi:hypothetical protein
MAADEPESPAWQHGGIKVVVALLDAGVAAAESAAMTIKRLSNGDDTNKDAIREAGGIAPLVARIGAGADSVTARYAARALMSLSDNDINKDAIRDAGGIAPLVALLGAGADSEAAVNAAGALMNLADNATNENAILEGVASCASVSTAFHTRLHLELERISTSRLIAAEAGDNVPALERAIRHGNALSLPADTLRRASERLAEMNGEAALQARRESLGLGALPLPNEFVCPITCKKMKGPLACRLHAD